jgi:predicted secreted protein
MRQNAVPAALARLGASLALLLFMLVPALAGDRALSDFIGYSEDGQYFAFEEYGVQDGSGAAYSHIYIVDLAADAWLDGTPISVDAIEDADPEARPLFAVRTDARAKAAKQLRALQIDVPVEIVSLLGEGVPDADGLSMVFSTPYCCGGPGQTKGDEFTLALTTFPITSGEDFCAEMNPVGYALTLNDGTDTVELHRDGKKLPGSRGCTTEYRLYAVLQPFEGGAGGRMAIVSSYRVGFEGPDRRFLAVPIDQ